MFETVANSPVRRAAKVRWYEVLATGLTAAVFYSFLFGTDTLWPTNYSWLLQGDPAQHYLGWQFFRQETWQWPPGRILSYGYPSGTAIVFTDSIPLLALVLKPISGLLPAEFQYFGLWMLACYALNGYFGLRLIARYTTQTSLRIAGSCFFILSPPLLLRGYGHEALMAHWLLLASLDTCLRGWSWPRWLLWSAIAALAHPYLLVMVLGFMAAGATISVGIDKFTRLPTALLQGTCIGLVLLILMNLAGHFSSTTSLSAGGYGYYNMNILSLVDPLLGWSRYIQQRPINSAYAELGNFGQYEGFLYLGVGMIMLVVMAIALHLAKPEPLPRHWWPVAAVALIFWLMALSNVITFGEKRLLTVPLPDALQAALSIFRASGRFGWPAFYLINLATLVLVVRHLPARRALAVLVAGLALQVADQSDKYIEFRGLIQARKGWQTPLQSPQWGSLAQRANTLLVVPPLPDMSIAYIPLAHLASKYGLATNAAQIARVDSAVAEESGRSIAQDLANGRYNPRVLYVIPQREGLAHLPLQLAGLVVELDGYFVLPPGLSVP